MGHCVRISTAKTFDKKFVNTAQKKQKLFINSDDRLEGQGFLSEQYVLNFSGKRNTSVAICRYIV